MKKIQRCRIFKLQHSTPLKKKIGYTTYDKICSIKTHNQLKERKATINSAIMADNELAEYKLFLRRDLSHLKKIHRQFGIGTIDIENHEQKINENINKLKKHITTRINYLLHLSEDRIFCEAFKRADGTYGINLESITKTPVNQFGSKDLDKGYIILTQVKLIKEPNVIKLIPIKLDLKTGIVTEEYDEEI